MRWVLLSLAVMTATAATPILHSNFDNEMGGWRVMGESGSLRVAREAAEMREGKPSLAFDYEIGRRKFAAAVLPVEPAALSAMDQIHFWVNTDFPTPVVVTLSEKDGGNYAAMAWSPGNVWQEVRLEPCDFALSDRPNDPPDPDGKLDVDQVQGIGLADLAQLFSGVPRNPAMPIAFTERSGKHILLISGFEVLTGNQARHDNLAIDQFDAPQLSWMSPGGAAFSIDGSRDHAPGPAMEIAYTEAENAIVYFARNLPPGLPANISHISFDIASEKAVQLVFTLQERGSGHGEGPRYNAIVEIKGKGKPDHRDLALSAFTLDQNGPPDASGALSIVKAKSLGIADISAAMNGDSGPNRIWISGMRFSAVSSH